MSRMRAWDAYINFNLKTFLESTKLLIPNVVILVIMVQYAGTSSCLTCQRDPIADATI
jgi:hypothetical protein